MFSRFQRFYTSIKVAIDVLMLALAFAAAFGLRFFVLGSEALPPWEDTLGSLALALVIFPVVFHQSRLYATNRARSHGRELFEVFKGVVLGTLVLVAITYFARDRYSRLTVALFAGTSFTLVAGMRLLMRSLLNQARRRGYNLKSILVIGAGELAERVVRTVDNHLRARLPGGGAARAQPDQGGHRDRRRAGGGAHRGGGSLPRSQPRGPGGDRAPGRRSPAGESPHGAAGAAHRGREGGPRLHASGSRSTAGWRSSGDFPWSACRVARSTGWNLVFKRVFDVLFALLALAVASPVMLLTAVLVKLTSRGPVFYAQERMGMDGRTFRILKFRTMRTDAEQAGAQMASKHDDRRTPIGTFLRKSSIDELPQIFNVLTGDMSLVGPRPERPVFIEEFKKQIPRYHLRHKVKAGITGWAQINGLRGQTSIEKRIEYDLYYIENWSLSLDLKILVKTALGGFLSKNAY